MQLVQNVQLKAILTAAQTFLSLPLPHFGQVEPAERPDPVRTIRVPPIVPVQFPLGQNAQPQRSHRAFSGGPDVPRPQPGQFAMASPLAF